MSSKKIMCQNIFSEHTLYMATTEVAYMKMLEKYVFSNFFVEFGKQYIRR